MDVLLAGLSGEQIRHWIRVEGRDPVELAADLGRIAPLLLT